MTKKKVLFKDQANRRQKFSASIDFLTFNQKPKISRLAIYKDFSKINERY